jgi:hypothetical protein
VAASRTTNPELIRFCVPGYPEDEPSTKNIVFRQLFRQSRQPPPIGGHDQLHFSQNDRHHERLGSDAFGDFQADDEAPDDTEVLAEELAFNEIESESQHSDFAQFLGLL